MHRSSRTFAIFRLTLVLALATQACQRDDDELDDPTGASSETDPAPTSGADDGSTGTSMDIDALYDCVDPDLTVIMPLSGPGYDPQAGLLEPVQDTYVVHTTQLLVKPDDASQGEFFALVEGVTAQLMESPGLVAVSLAIEPNCGFSRTLGVWRSQEDMYNFAGSGAHAEAMGRTTAISVTGKVTHWEISADAMPIDWPTAIAHIDAVEPSSLYGE